MNTQVQVILAKPRGFCAGVRRAVAIVETALEKFGAPIYVKHEIVHNRRVVDNLKERGAIFVEEIEQIPNGSITIFSAHGVSKKVINDANKSELKSLDATCPLVTKVHIEGQRFASQGADVILIGHENHPEVEGTIGQIDGRVHLVSDIDDVKALKLTDPDKVAYVTQTTLSVDDTKEIIKELKNKYPTIRGQDTKDICYATQNRQTAVRSLAKETDLVLVVGAQNSSNSNRLCEVSKASGVNSYLIQDPSKIRPEWLNGVKKIGITAGASTPEELVQEVIQRLREYVDLDISTMDGVTETVHFKLPNALTKSNSTVRT